MKHEILHSKSWNLYKVAASRFRVVIPARYASSRFPGKPLITLHGKPMLQWVYSAALSSGACEVVIATDDQRIKAAAQAFSANVVCTDLKHHSGTERIAEVARNRGWSNQDIIVNLQGDEPCTAVANIAQVAALLESNDDVDMATLSRPLADQESPVDSNLVKLVCDPTGRALYFSRSSIPWTKSRAAYRIHLGLYAYRVKFLQQYVAWQPAVLEQYEKLEQLRALSNGAKIMVASASALQGPGVDVPGDVAAAEAWLRCVKPN